MFYHYKGFFLVWVTAVSDLVIKIRHKHKVSNKNVRNYLLQGCDAVHFGGQ
jgi:hypothetical protein